ncbi:MAG TPA: hypothetical protein VGP68_21860, partial [Gemmataceae bacterium]|nr:hypothetical protein [Gemmataceae bacterium]
MSASAATSPTQPNLDLSAVESTWSPRFWLITVLTGAAAGLAGGLLMRLLESVEHIAWGYEAGTLLEAAARAPVYRYVLNLLGAGFLVGFGGTLIRNTLGRSGDADASIWFRSGRMPALSTLAQGVLSIVTVGMG